MVDTPEVCTACEGSGHLLVWDGHPFQRPRYKAHPKLPCTVCKGYRYMRPVSDEPEPVQLTLTQSE